MTKEPIVFVVDGDGQSRDSIRRLLESMRVKCSPCRSGQEFFEQYDGCCLGCAVLELRIADMGGLQIQRHLREAGLLLPVVFLTGYGTIGSAVRSLKAGAVDFLEKPCADDGLWDTIQRAIQLSRVRHEKWQAHLEWNHRFAALTAAQRNLLELVVGGNSSQEIATMENVSIRTVEARRSKLLAKLEVDSTNGLLHAVLEQQSRESWLTDTICPRHAEDIELPRIAPSYCASAQDSALLAQHQSV